MILFSSRHAHPTAFVVLIALIGTLILATTTQAGAEASLETWVTDNAERVVEATITEAHVVTADDAAIWTNFVLASDDDALNVLVRGGVDTESGRWQYASHSAELAVGMDVVAALVPADGFVPQELLAASHDAWVIYGGADGVSIKSTPRAQDPAIGTASILPSSYYTGSRWASMPIPIRINMNVNTLIRSGTSDAIQRSLSRWTAVVGSDAKFQYLGTSGTNESNLPFSNSIFAGELAGQLGETVWTGTNNLETITSYEIILNSGALPYGSTWSIGAASGTYDAESVILHELGHVIGIGHTGEAYSIMYPTLFRAESKLNLSSIDLEALRTLYPTSECGFATPETIRGTPGNDVLYGTAGPDVIIGGGGDDTIIGGAGDDKLCGDDGSDNIWGQDGNDTIYGGTGDDKIRSADGNDTIYGGYGKDNVNGGRGNDKIYGQADDDTILGGVDDDTIDGGDGNDFLSGNGGYDTVHGGNGRDEIRGGPRPDSLYGDADNDILKGFGGGDSLYGGDGNDELLGGLHSDRRLDGGSGTDICNGGEGDESAAILVGCSSVMNVP